MLSIVKYLKQSNLSKNYFFLVNIINFVRLIKVIHIIFFVMILNETLLTLLFYYMKWGKLNFYQILRTFKGSEMSSEMFFFFFFPLQSTAKRFAFHKPKSMMDIFLNNDSRNRICRIIIEILNSSS